VPPAADGFARSTSKSPLRTFAGAMQLLATERGQHPGPRDRVLGLGLLQADQRFRLSGRAQLSGVTGGEVPQPGTYHGESLRRARRRGRLTNGAQGRDHLPGLADGAARALRACERPGHPGPVDERPGHPGPTSGPETQACERPGNPGLRAARNPGQRAARNPGLRAARNPGLRFDF
jgi:hypothetical protein